MAMGPPHPLPSLRPLWKATLGIWSFGIFFSKELKTVPLFDTQKTGNYSSDFKFSLESVPISPPLPPLLGETAGYPIKKVNETPAFNNFFMNFYMQDSFVSLSRRSKHTLVAWNDALYVFGGDNG